MRVIKEVFTDRTPVELGVNGRRHRLKVGLEKAQLFDAEQGSEEAWAITNIEIEDPTGCDNYAEYLRVHLEEPADGAVIQIVFADGTSCAGAGARRVFKKSEERFGLFGTGRLVEL